MNTFFYCLFYITGNSSDCKQKFCMKLLKILFDDETDLHGSTVDEKKKKFLERFGKLLPDFVNDFASVVNSTQEDYFSAETTTIYLKTGYDDQIMSDSGYLSVLDSVNTKSFSFQSHAKVNQISTLQTTTDPDIVALENILNNFDFSHSFFLITSKLTPSCKALKDLSKIPWLKVFDFDVDSRNAGLLSMLESDLKSKRALKFNFSQATQKQLSDKAIEWVFPLGFSDHQDTIFEGDAIDWFELNNESLVMHFSDIADFCLCTTSPVFIILWYDYNKFHSECLSFFMSLLFTKISKKHRRMVIFCYDQTMDFDPLLNDIKKFKLTETSFKIPLEKVCTWLKQNSSFHDSTFKQFKIPFAPSKKESFDRTTTIPPNDIGWIQQYIEIVPVEVDDNFNSDCSNDSSEIFLKGGIIAWKDLEKGLVAVDREAQHLVNINDILETEILEFKKSFILNIFHEPGGGGTTFGRQLLYLLHREVPCGVVLPSFTLTVNELWERIDFIHKTSSLPVVILIDGRQHEHIVYQVLDVSTCPVVVIFVQQINSSLLNNSFDSQQKKCTLSGLVTHNEAKKLVKLFSEFVSPDKIKKLKYCADIAEDNKHYLIEYGLTAFDSEFTTVQSFVRSYLELQLHGLQIMNLQPWQKVLAYLSLVTYYSQGSVNQEVFRKVLQVKGYECVSKKDLSFAAHDCFIFEKDGFWRIRYYIIAKEILEQILNKFSENPNTCNDLSNEAKVNLHELVIDFVKMLKNVFGHLMSTRLKQLLFDMILRRDVRGVDKPNQYGGKKPLSKLLEDIPKSENQILILKELTASFPESYDFHAHLGRLLGILGQIDEASNSFETAIDLFKKSSGKKYQKDNDLGQLYNMYGYACLTEANSSIRTSEALEIVQGPFKFVKKAIEHFKLSRNYLQNNFSYSYMGEIKARLVIARYIHFNFSKQCKAAFVQSTWPRELIELKSFVQESYPICATLFDRCYYLHPIDAKRSEKDLDICKKNFSLYFPDSIKSIPGWNPQYQRYSEIAQLKSYCSNGSFSYNSSIKKITKVSAIKKVVELCEASINESLHSKKPFPISVYVLQWLDAIRQPLIEDNYHLAEKILPVIRSWNNKKEGIHSTYYLLIVHFILSLFSHHIVEQRLSLDEMKNCRKALKNFSQAKYISVDQIVLSNSSNLTVRKLLSLGKNNSANKGLNFWKNHKLINQFQVFTGTIVKINNSTSGKICLDLKNSLKASVKVFFVPMMYNFIGQRYVDECCKVEFFITFTVSKGAEAIVVQKLSKSECEKCQKNNFIVTLTQKKNICVECHMLSINFI